ncbi:hypothetical protein [Paenibacillus macerans]|uniref:hypothetical protein n=1 Tax=Paenibacillus macerans TaxID=44252 RepID=UPI00203D2747|nr:hypothetical protein [Paenibacillus macerans]MCM3701478.1 hypothetical protein [Paenibacillus macerans]
MYFLSEEKLGCGYYDYDANGNILSKKENPLLLKEVMLLDLNKAGGIGIIKHGMGSDIKT